MSVEFKIDDREFQETLKRYLAVSSRTLPQALNEKMFYIVRGAVTRLPKVEKSKIETDLGLGGYELQYTKAREAKPKVNKVNVRRALRNAAKSVASEFARDAKQFGRNTRRNSRALQKSGRAFAKSARRSGKAFSKSARRLGKRFGRKIRKAFR